ncbi:PDR/VanB family oxidoreductase [Hirschia litorea]|uniref:PDR/VanB family oxidoreductase n=1 Tax=Hirschia litorea TaxID=1199156 RepID=A0ABW2IJR5_9PROT
MSDNEILSLIVKSRKELPGQVVSLELGTHDNSNLTAFSAGAHIDVHTKSGCIRQYSLWGSPEDTTVYKLGVLKELESRGGSRSIHDDIEIGDQLFVSEPRNHFPLVEASQRNILIGGGIGITPILSMAYQLQAEGKDFSLHYCVMDQSKSAFWDVISSSAFADKAHLHCSHSNDAPSFDIDADIPQWEEGTHLYTCGPSGFMDWILSGAEAKGYESAYRHKEDFGADVDTSGDTFTVEARKSGVTVEVKDGQTIASVLKAAGVDIDVSCEEGVCGTCLSDVLEGDPDHRGEYLTDEEKVAGDVILVCCSRSKSPKLVLDL